MDAGQHADAPKRSVLRSLLSFLFLVALVVGLSWLLREFVIQPYEIPSGSMETTIMTGDKVFSERVSYYFRDIEPGDIVTFEDKEIPGRILIKRCIATGGQTVDLIDGRVYVDGVALDEPYTHGLPSDPFASTLVDISYPYTVPEGELWMMGDNRTNSKDSRYFGSVKESSVTGKGCFIYWPLENFGVLQ
ncbi:signal peptidase I [Raoultibacter phocaeensis]|uniref:signal peptidase I n=1 Tax=Raoultibacter phocaeensis TaxID=2479841 RepID=UPI00111AC288|nr:signal peptidase I [Raoultibacter phocaeensis]